MVSVSESLVLLTLQQALVGWQLRTIAVVAVDVSGRGWLVGGAMGGDRWWGAQTVLTHRRYSICSGRGWPGRGLGGATNRGREVMGWSGGAHYDFFGLHPSSEGGRERGGGEVGQEVGREGRVRGETGGQGSGSSAGSGRRFDVALDWSHLNSLHTLSWRLSQTVERENMELLGVVRMLLLQDSLLEDSTHLVGGGGTEREVGEENGESPLKVPKTETYFVQKENIVYQQTSWQTEHLLSTSLVTFQITHTTTANYLFS